MILNWIALGGAFTATAFGQVTYKLFAQTGKGIHLALAVFFFVLAPLCSYIALQQIGIGTVYIGAAIAQVMVLGLSHYMLKEHVSRDHIIAMTLIVAGLILFIQ